MADGNDILQFSLKDTVRYLVLHFALVGNKQCSTSSDIPVEILRGTDGDNGVGICQAREDADSVNTLVLVFILDFGLGAESESGLILRRGRTRWSFQIVLAQP